MRLHVDVCQVYSFVPNTQVSQLHHNHHEVESEMWLRSQVAYVVKLTLAVFGITA